MNPYREIKHIKEFAIPTHSDDWYTFRTTGIPEVYEGGIGASEMGKLLGQDKYRPVLAEVFHHKIGSYKPEPIENIATEYGKLMEPIIRGIWKFQLTNSDEDRVQALKAYQQWKDFGKLDPNAPYRECDILGTYLVNEKTPWIFASLDGAICKGQPTTYGEVLAYPAPLEIKTIEYWAAQQWEDRVPPKYLTQIQTQMVVTESEYAELAIMEARCLSIYSFTKIHTIQEAIIEVSKQFWERIMKGRALWAEFCREEEEAKRMQIWAEIINLEPLPDSSEAYKEFYAARMLVNAEAQIMKLPTFVNLRKYKYISAIIKELEEVKQLLQNMLLRDMALRNTSKLEFKKEGMILGYVSKGKQFTTKLKHDINEDLIHQRVKELVAKGLE